MWSGAITKRKRVLRPGEAPWPQNLAVGLFTKYRSVTAALNHIWFHMALMRHALTPSMSSHFVDPSHNTLDPVDQHFHEMLNGRHVKAYGDGQPWCNHLICLGNLRRRAPVISRILEELRVTATALNFTHDNFQRQRVFTTLREAGSLQYRACKSSGCNTGSEPACLNQRPLPSQMFPWMKRQGRWAYSLFSDYRSFPLIMEFPFKAPISPYPTLF